MGTQTKSEASGRGIVKMQVISRCLGEIYAYIPQWGEFYSSINKNDDGRTVRSRKPAYVWDHYSSGIAKRAQKVCNQVKTGELPTGRMEYGGNVCAWDVLNNSYVTDIDMWGHRRNVEHSSISDALLALLVGTSIIMEARLLSYEERRKNE